MKYSTKTQRDCDMLIKKYELGMIKILETWQYYLAIFVYILLIIAYLLK